MTTVVQRLRWVWLLLLGLTWFTTAPDAPASGCDGENNSTFAAKGGREAVVSELAKLECAANPRPAAFNPASLRLQSP